MSDDPQSSPDPSAVLLGDGAEDPGRIATDWNLISHPVPLPTVLPTCCSC